DHHARLVSIEENCVLLTIEAVDGPPARRASDRPVTFRLEVSFSEEQFQFAMGLGTRSASSLRTRIHVAIRPKRHRDRRRSVTFKRARQLLVSLRSYLMAAEAELATEDRAALPADNVLGTSLAN